MKKYTFNVEVFAIEPQAAEYDNGWCLVESFEDEEKEYAERDAMEAMAEYVKDDYIRGCNGWYAYRIVEVSNWESGD